LSSGAKAWNPQTAAWSPHGYKHNSKLSTPWSKTRAWTKRPNGDAKYKPEINNKLLETRAIERGSFIYEEPGFRAYYYLCRDTIGASDGVDTDLIYVEWRCCQPSTYHGYPISEKELIDALNHKKRYRARYKLQRILRPYKKFWNLHEMTTINWSAILCPLVKVHFSWLKSAETERPVNVTLSLLELPNDMYIDVKWSVSDSAFLVSLFVNPFTIDTEDNILGRAVCRSVDRVIDAVKRFAEDAIKMSSGCLYASRSVSATAPVTVIFPNVVHSGMSFEISGTSSRQQSVC
jgi:hypothetical protein